MSDILCIYYSRTGNTKKAVEKIARELDAEVLELRDGVDRSGWPGLFGCSGLEAMRRTTHPLKPIETQRPLKDYLLGDCGDPGVGRPVQQRGAGLLKGVWKHAA